MKRLILFLAAMIACQAQSAVQTLLYYSGSNLQYQCTAKSTQPKTATITVSAASNANPVSFTATAHNLFYTATSTVLPIVNITGGTGNWAAVNGNWVATPTSANAFTIPVDSTAFGALTGTLVVTTLSPRLTDAVWKVETFQYDGSNNLLFHGVAVAAAGAGTAPVTGPGNVGPPDQFNQICANRASLAYQ
jgi:hypothetical protein